MNASGQKHYPAWTNRESNQLVFSHSKANDIPSSLDFDPKSTIFDARHRFDVLLSDAALIATLALFVPLAQSLGGWTQFSKYYFVPYLLVNASLVHITFLQHSDSRLPHYRSSQWTFTRGALCTIDRSFLGPIGRYLLHGISETHVLHHVSSKIPHYHAEEATRALKQYLGEHYFSTDENVFKSLWKNHRECRYVDKEGEIVWYRDAYGRARRTTEVVHPASDSGVEGI